MNWAGALSGVKMKTKAPRIAIAIIVLIVLGLATFTCLRNSHEEARQQRLNEVVEGVRSGESWAFIRDPSLVSMLAADPVCVANLERIYLEPNDLSDPRYDRLKDLSNVREVHCCYFRVGPKSLEFIAAMPSIERISFAKYPISDDSVRKLAEIVSLQQVTFIMMDVPKEAVDSLKVDRPDLTILFDGARTVPKRELKGDRLLFHEKVACPPLIPFPLFHRR
jgi:hypothetical protein